MYKTKLAKELNSFGQTREPILFIIDYKLQNYYLSPLSKLNSGIEYEINNRVPKIAIDKRYYFRKEHISKERYKIAFEQVIEEITNGNTYLLNLTYPTLLDTNLTIDEIYNYSNAKFKLKFFDKFVCFSPERFIKIDNNKIETYPMKGTIDAKIKNAKKIILESEKELAEHTMVVDLLRNDLSIIAKKVTVERFRYIDRVKNRHGELLQVSSKISAVLEENWQDRLGEIITNLLPAGSITGTPKRSTVNIIEKLEGYERGYFTGVFGIFDGGSLDSGVMIRYIERDKRGLIYKSGGGVTIDSKMEDEYKEMCDKVYLPFS